MIFKYIITETGCIVFSPSINHRSMSIGVVPISAGFVKIVAVEDKIKVECFGGSESLAIESRGLKDAKVIELWGSILTNNLSKGF